MCSTVSKRKARERGEEDFTDLLEIALISSFTFFTKVTECNSRKSKNVNSMLSSGSELDSKGMFQGRLGQ